MERNIIIIPDSFKGSMSSKEVSDIIGKVVSKYTDDNIIKMPVADGGEGSMKCITGTLGGRIKKVSVTSPDMKSITAEFGITPDDTAIIELAESSGITKQDKLNPMSSNTYGFGEQIKAALDLGLDKFTLCIGGSASTDCGLGCAAALGVKFYDKAGSEIIPCGGNLKNINKIDISGIDERIKNCTFTVMSDVDNPLYGKNGAAYIYAPQKGADDIQVKELDEGLIAVAELIKKTTGISHENIKGAGAAGGSGYGLCAFLHAKLISGIEAMLDIYRFDDYIDSSDLVITGEGRIDKQSLMGKVLSGIKAHSKNVPVIAFCGSCLVDSKELLSKNITAIEIGKGLSLEESIKNGKTNLKKEAERYFRK